MSPNVRYVSGANFERRCRTKLQDAGYFCVRSAGSHSVADLVAINEDFVFLIQCKNNGKISKKERDKLINTADKCLAEPMLALKNKSKRVEFRYADTNEIFEI